MLRLRRRLHGGSLTATAVDGAVDAAALTTTALLTALARVRVPRHVDVQRRRRVRYRAARLSGYLLRRRHCGPVVYVEGEAVHARQRRRPQRHGATSAAAYVAAAAAANVATSAAAPVAAFAGASVAASAAASVAAAAAAHVATSAAAAVGVGGGGHRPLQAFGALSSL